MSYQKVLFGTALDRNQLLDLFLGRGDIQVAHEGQLITVYGINDRHVLREVEDGELHTVNIIGMSASDKVGLVDGQGTLKLNNSNKDLFILNLEINLHD